MPRRRHRKGSGPQPLAQDVFSPGGPQGEISTYLIKQSDRLGRYLVASRSLSEGTVVISEDALVVGPAQDSRPLCLGCYQPLPDVTSAYRCEKCKWPMCSNKCKGLFKRFGHSKEECSQLTSCEVTSPELPPDQLYNSIVPLRCLLLKQHQPDKWKTLMSMEAHNDIRKENNSIWSYNQRTVVDRIKKEWKITAYSEGDIHTVCGILEVNAFAVGDDSLNIRGLYPTSFFIAHSCIPNTSHTDDDEYHMKVFTSVPISKDEMITLSYTNSLVGTRKRRDHLKQCKFFECECPRCKDPTELGTYLSALKCGECDCGHLLPADPLCPDSTWTCCNKQCHASLTASDIDTVLLRINTEIKSLDNNSIEELENSIKRYSGVLHPNHYILLGMKYTLSQLYGKSVGFLIHDMTEAMLERKKEVCEDVLQVFNVLEPGFTCVRGLTMYELHAPIMVLTIRRFEAHKISKVDLSRSLRTVASYLRECSWIFRLEPKSSQEGHIRVAVEDALIQLKSWEPVTGKL